MESFHFSNPSFSVFFLILPLFFFIILGSAWKKKKILQVFLGNQKAQEVSRSTFFQRIVKNICLLLGSALCVMALIRPQWGYEWREVKQKGINLMILVDTSASMGAGDLSPSRMERAKRKIKDLIPMLQGDRVGLVAFAGAAHVLCPLTRDYGALELFVDSLETDLIASQGTNLEEALALALKAVEAEKANRSVFLLLTDGEKTEGEVGKIFSQLQKKEIPLFVMGMGTPEGAPIPSGAGGGFKTDERGEIVVSKLDEAGLQKIAEQTGGKYSRITLGDDDLHALYLQGVRGVGDPEEVKGGKKKVPLERYQIPLGLAVFLLGVL